MKTADRSTIRQLKAQLAEHLTYCCMDTLKEQGVEFDSAEKVYSRIMEAMEDCLSRGEFRI